MSFLSLNFRLFVCFIFLDGLLTTFSQGPASIYIWYYSWIPFPIHRLCKMFHSHLLLWFTFFPMVYRFTFSCVVYSQHYFYIQIFGLCIFCPTYSEIDFIFIIANNANHYRLNLYFPVTFWKCFTSDILTFFNISCTWHYNTI